MGLFLVSFVILAFFTTCNNQVPAVNAVRTFNLHTSRSISPDHLVLGSGYDSLTDEVRNKCIKRKKPFSLEFTEKQEFSVRIVEGYDHLARSLEIQPLSIFQYNRNSLHHARAELMVRAKIHDYHHFVLISKKINIAEWFLESITLKEKYQDYYNRNGRASFKSRCGDQFLNSFFTGWINYILLDISSISADEQSLLETLLASFKGDYRPGKEFSRSVSALLKFRIKSLILLEGNNLPKFYKHPTDHQLQEIRDRFMAKPPGPSYPHSLKFKPYQIPGPEGETFHKMVQKTKNSLLESRDLFYRILRLQANLDYIKMNTVEFPGSDPTEMDEYDDIMVTTLAQIQRNVNRCNSGHPACLQSMDSMHKLTAINLPARKKAGKIHSSVSLCDSPVYKEGTGPACGVLRYHRKRSLYCGVEEYRKTTNKLCPGYVPPLGPRVLKEIPGELRETDSDYGLRRQQLDGSCRKKFGGDWIFSSVSTDQQHPHTPSRSGESIFFANCIRLAKISSCRHPSHGVETYKECEHENHGVLRYRTCRSPAFGVELFSPAGCDLGISPDA